MGGCSNPLHFFAAVVMQTAFPWLEEWPLWGWNVRGLHPAPFSGVECTPALGGRISDKYIALLSVSRGRCWGGLWGALPIVTPLFGDGCTGGRGLWAPHRLFVVAWSMACKQSRNFPQLAHASECHLDGKKPSSGIGVSLGGGFAAVLSVPCRKAVCKQQLVLRRYRCWEVMLLQSEFWDVAPHSTRVVRRYPSREAREISSDTELSSGAGYCQSIAETPGLQMWILLFLSFLVWV